MMCEFVNRKCLFELADTIGQMTSEISSLSAQLESLRKDVSEQMERATRSLRAQIDDEMRKQRELQLQTEAQRKQYEEQIYG